MKPKNDIAVIPLTSLRSKVISLLWTGCPVCGGLADQFGVDQLSSLPWTQCPVWSGKRSIFNTDTPDRIVATDQLDIASRVSARDICCSADLRVSTHFIAWRNIKNSFR